MARLQVLTANNQLNVTVPGTAVPLVGSSLYAKSVVIQARPSNTDFVQIGDSSVQNFSLAPGKSVEIHGDNMDNGTSGKLDLNSIYVDAIVAGEGVYFMYLDRI